MHLMASYCKPITKYDSCMYSVVSLPRKIYNFISVRHVVQAFPVTVNANIISVILEFHAYAILNILRQLTWFPLPEVGPTLPVIGIFKFAFACKTLDRTRV